MSNFSAVLVGINKYPDCPLRGCVNDIIIMRDILVKVYKIPAHQIRLILDERATKDNILERLEWLVDSEFENKLFYYSGHGAQIPVQTYSNTNYEPDSMDELLCPVDFSWEGTYILDNNIEDITKKLKPNHHISMVVDACHSGSIDKAKKTWDTLIRQIPTPLDLLSRLSDTSLTASLFDDVKESDIVNKLDKDFFASLFPDTFIPPVKTPSYSDYNVSVITGCRDDQTSADAYFINRYQGALSYVMQNLILRNPGIDLKTLRDRCEEDLSKRNFEQVPQLICSETNLIKPFIQV
jgi:hypothetical protein